MIDNMTILERYPRLEDVMASVRTLSVWDYIQLVPVTLKIVGRDDVGFDDMNLVENDYITFELGCYIKDTEEYYKVYCNKTLDYTGIHITYSATATKVEKLEYSGKGIITIADRSITIPVIRLEDTKDNSIIVKYLAHGQHREVNAMAIFSYCRTYYSLQQALYFRERRESI